MPYFKQKFSRAMSCHQCRYVVFWLEYDPDFCLFGDYGIIVVRSECASEAPAQTIYAGKEVKGLTHAEAMRFFRAGTGTGLLRGLMMYSCVDPVERN